MEASRLLLLRCVAPRAREDAAAVRAALTENVDWTALVDTALRHGILPLLYAVLRDTAAGAVPDELLEAMSRLAERNHARQRELLRELLAILDALDARNVSAIPFKGPSVALHVYGELSLRRAGDLDLLVREANVDATLRVLTDRGYREQQETQRGRPLDGATHAAYRRYQCEYLLQRARDGIAVEPHWTLAPPMLSAPIDYAALWSRAQTITALGRPSLSFSDEDLALALSVHAAKHEWSELRWICDLAWLVARKPQLDWSEALLRARQQGCERMLLIGLALTQRLLGQALPPPAVHRLAADPVAQLLAAEQEAKLFDPTWHPPSIFQVSRFRLRMRERLRDRALCLVRTLATPRLEHVDLLALPTRLAFLYAPLKLVHDYAVMPVWRAARPVLERVSIARLRPTPVEAVRARAAWSERSASWDRLVDAGSDVARQLDGALLEAGDVGPAQRILDLASGVGPSALAAAERAGEHGFVMASDFVPEMLAGVRRRARAAGLTSLRYFAADMNALPLRDACVDRVLCRFGIMFCADVDRALGEVLRVLRAGGRAAWLVWGPLEDNTLAHVLDEVTNGFFAGRAPLANRAPFRFADTGTLEAALTRAGFRAIAAHEVRLDMPAATNRDFWRPQLELACGPFLEALPAATRRALDGALEAAFASRRTAAGLRLRVHARLVTGCKARPPA